MNAAAPLRMGRTEWTLLLFLSVIWGGSFFFAKVALVELPPLVLALGRVGIAALLLAGAHRSMGLRLPRRLSDWRALAGMGVLNCALPYTLYFWGQTHIASGLAAILNATTPLFGVVIAHLWGRVERLTAARLLGVALGVAGVATMLGPGLIAGDGTDTMAELACLGGAFSYGIAGVYGRKRLAHLPPLTSATGQIVSAAAIMAVAVAAFEPGAWTLHLGARTAAAVLALAAISTALAYVIYFRILARAGATNILLVTLLIPVSAVMLGALFLGERLEARHFAGMAAIALGLAAIDGRPFAALRRALAAA